MDTYVEICLKIMVRFKFIFLFECLDAFVFIPVLSFVLITIFALLGGWIAGAYGTQIQSVDTNVGALLGALVAGFVVGLSIDELDIAAGLLGGVATAAGVIAGRALGSMIRTDSVTHTEDAPGALSMFDGAIVAAPLFWVVLWLFA